MHDEKGVWAQPRGETVDWLLGLPPLVGDAVAATASLVERLHTRVAGRALDPLARLVPGGMLVRSAHHAVAGTVYAAIRTTAHGVGRAGEVGLTAAVAVRPLTVPGAAQRRLLHGVGILNGLYGDQLRPAHARLDLGMTLHHAADFAPVTPAALQRQAPHLTHRLCIFVHGVCCTEQAWHLFTGPAPDDLPMSARLCAELGLTPLYLRYNSGRPIAANGRQLASRLGELVAAYPRPVEEIVLIGHSMGGLVARSAAHYAQVQGEPWVAHLRRIICLGTPHRGAPLEQAAHRLSSLLGAIPVSATRALAAVLNRRSAGLKDLRLGSLRDAAGPGSAPGEGVETVSVVATVARDPAHWTGRLLGDLLVRPASAGYIAPRAGRQGRVHTLGKLHHLNLLNHPAVYAVLHSNLA
jgi:pimeloyl-ACP methyl ester carboxylesterase